ncbi:MAG: Gfo/Idh/MocA family oxidoreductase [Reichenbachiella sp.]|uniref:Gfo/Idh/MocA family protein n=1 Tax=Reichenbachiella sp. TaxID=2184521 RepID=UPI003266EFE1
MGIDTNTNDRRKFLKNTAITGVGLSLLSPEMLFAQQKKKIKLAFIGVGARGVNHVRLALQRTDIEVTAICDIDKKVLQRAKDMTEEAGHKPVLFGDGDYAYRKLLEREDVDAVIISTPWLWHTPMAVDTMKAGKAVGLEVAGAMDIKECWDLVNVQEQTQVPFMILENVCYRRDVMAVFAMAKKGLFGELVHLEGGYQHDLRHVKFNDGQQLYGGGVEFGEKGYSEARWRTEHSVNRNGDLYPTHGLGPVHTMLDINRGNRYAYLTSTATKSKGLHNYIVNHPKGGKNHPNADIEFKLGDIVTTVIKTANDETITLNHDTNLPRPYSLGFRVQGTNGLWMDLNNSIYVEGVSPSHKWESDEKYLKEYDHHLWRKHEKLAAGAGHGGMDFFVLNAFVEALKRDAPMPLDVYDCATWAAVTCLSEESILKGSEPVQFPDFTRGRWMKRNPIFGREEVPF